MKEQIKQKGITLVALVITIILLLILAGITISALGGENGLIAKSKKAKEKQMAAEMEEELVLAIQSLQTEKSGKATIDDITQEWLNQHITNSKCNIVEEDETKGKTVSMQKNGHTAGFLIDLSLNVTEKDITISTIEFSYEQTEKNGEDVKILIKVRDKINGLNKVIPPDGDEIIIGGSKEEKGIDANVKVGVEYKYKVISMSGEEKEETIFVEPTLTTTTPIINTTTNATSSAETNSIEKVKTLYINFSATMDMTGGTTTIVNKDDGNPVPYAVRKNGTYTFSVTGTYGENKTITKEVEVKVDQYQSALNLVQYDAGDWTESEIQSLQSAGLYNLNVSKTGSTALGLNYTFGGFTHKGDKENSSYINNRTIITSRNQSVAPGSVYGTPKYEGWQILESEEKDGKTYVTKLVHAGSPENFVYHSRGGAYDAEYILSSGLRKTSYNTYSPRSWQMYIDNSQKDLIADITDKDGNTVKDIHAMTYDEAIAIKESISTAKVDIDTGAYFYLAIANDSVNIYYVMSNGNILRSYGGPCGVRPVVSLKSGVYIKSGSGTEEDPYVLAIE